MEHAQARLMTLLAAVLLAVVAALYLWDAPEEEVDPDAIAQVWDLSVPDVRRIEVERADSALVLVRQGEDWLLERGGERLETDPHAVQELLDALGELARGVPVVEDPAPDELEAYGLGDPPVARIRATLAGDRVAQAVVGSRAPVGWRTYALSDQGDVIAVNGRPGDILTAPVSRFRDHRVFRFVPGAVRRVTLESPQGVLSVHGRGKRWWVDGFTRADADRVDDLVMGLLDLRVDTFTDFPEPLGSPSITVTIESEGGETERLHVGERGPMGTVIWTDAGLEGFAFPESLALLGQGPTDLGDRQAFPLDLERAEAVSVQRGDLRWEAVRDGPAWKVGGLPSPDAALAVERLAEAAIHYRREPVPALDEPWATVQITEADGIFVIDLGQEVEGSWRVAQDRAGGGPYLVPLEDLAVFDAL